jgi:hypothetical protein
MGGRASNLVTDYRSQITDDSQMPEEQIADYRE